MRLALSKVALAVTSMVALAFLIPLALTVREAAHAGAVSAARRQAAAIGPVLGATRDPAVIAAALATDEGERSAVQLPGGQVVGPARVSAAQLSRAPASGIVRVVDGESVLQPVLLADGQTAMIEVFVPATEITRGLVTSWAVLAAVALALITTSVVVADRLAARMVRSARNLSRSAQALGAGDLDVRVESEGPYEFQEVGQAFNVMAERIRSLLDGEREFSADISHRLRTPLTALRLSVARLDRGPESDQVRSAVAALEREVDHVIRLSRIGRRSGAPPRCDATAVLLARITFWSALAEDQGRTLSSRLPEHAVEVPMSAADLTAVIDALIGNVFRHTPGGTDLAVGLAATRERVTVTVADAGPGLADSAARGTGATGMGLDIVRRQAESAGGSLQLGRSVMGGVAATVRLPPAGSDVVAPPGRFSLQRRIRLS